ncbi:MAG TPA: NAD(P)H-dependent oxidoreductase [Candidatus Absconditabacterales bacterium]|nr:NAD(P)H-dependent oxidoreductase [Candidatus Absconditabacterales bacterium]HMT26722.1 NAD(P)H-dependent oxidoreductase [Candidatus Absconditabacterales bacterium]
MKNQVIKALNRRYATKNFDSSKKVTDNDLEIILEAARLTASSFGLQPYEILVIKNQATREKLRHASYGQSQITEASHLIVLATRTDINDNLVEKYIENISMTRNMPLENLESFSEMIKNSLKHLDDEGKIKRAQKQTYIVLGNMLTTLALLEIDATPMEGFAVKEYDEILNLKEKNLTATLVLPVGFRSQQDPYISLKKVRKTPNEIIKFID